MRITFLTLFPECFPGTLGCSVIGRALENKLWSFRAINIRDFAEDKHKTVDDTPYGGGPGMIMKPDVIAKAVDHALQEYADLPVMFYTSPRGQAFTQRMAHEISGKNIMILCGRFEGVDQRVLDYYNFKEVSIGSYVLCGGEVAAQVIAEAALRLVPGVVGDSDSLLEESFSANKPDGFLEQNQYTRPQEWRGLEVPKVLLSGNHAEIQRYRNKA